MLAFSFWKENAVKIIGRDNYGRESVADFLVCENVANEFVGNIMIDALNANTQGLFYSLQPDDYKLWRGMEEFI
jgi:hypothetical protein